MFGLRGVGVGIVRLPSSRESPRRSPLCIRQEAGPPFESNVYFFKTMRCKCAYITSDIYISYSKHCRKYFYLKMKTLFIYLKKGRSYRKIEEIWQKAQIKLN